MICALRPYLISTFIVALCCTGQWWLHVLGGDPEIGRFPAFPYLPTLWFLGYFFGLRVGFFSLAISLLFMKVFTPAFLELQPLQGRIGVLVGMVGGLFVVNILKKIIEEERRKREAQRNFMTMMAHEFKNPLAVLEASAYSMALTIGPDLAKDRLRNHSRALDDISSILNRILEVDLVEGQKISIEPKSIQVRAFLLDIIDDFPATGRIELHCAFKKTIMSDPLLLRRILTNLVDNALKYGSVEGRVRLAATPERRRLKSGMAFRCVSQIGEVGVPDRNRVFSKYYRSADATTIRGAGVGLWLCKEFVDVLSGVIRLEEDWGEVSFYVWIPDLSK